MVVQGDAFNRSRLATIVVVPVTSNTRLASMPGNVFIASSCGGLSRDSVANVTQIIAVDRRLLVERVGRLPQRLLELILGGIDLVLGRETVGAMQGRSEQ